MAGTIKTNLIPMSGLQKNGHGQGRHSQDRQKYCSQYYCKQDIAKPEAAEMALDLFPFGMSRRAISTFYVCGPRNLAFCDGVSAMGSRIRSFLWPFIPLSPRVAANGPRFAPMTYLDSLSFIYALLSSFSWELMMTNVQGPGVQETKALQNHDQHGLWRDRCQDDPGDRLFWGS